MHFEILLEEPSAEAALQILLPKILPDRVEWAFHVFSGKTDLLRKLPSRLRGYKRWLPEDYKIVVLLDRDEEDCIRLKDRLEAMADAAGLLTKSKTKSKKFQVLNRLAIEELEAWFLGDQSAICTAYPRVSKTFWKRAKYADPDSLTRTWESLEKLLQFSHYHVGGLEKIKAAKEISTHMNPDENRSKSFNCFCSGLCAALN